MSETPSERPSRFDEFVPLDQDMPVEQAINWLADWHETTKAAVLAAFFNLREKAQEGEMVIFKESRNSGYESVSLNGNGWRCNINDITGQPQMICG